MKPTAVSVVFQHSDFADHEQVVFCADKATSLRAIIAVHDTTLGPAIGGVRVWPYGSEASALKDVLRLSEAMSYKCALADIPMGGGKTVVMGDPKTCKTPALLKALSGAINQLGGKYIAGEDVGFSVDDIRQLSTHTKHVRGLPDHGIGDPSPHTAFGVLTGMEAALRHRFGNPSFVGRKICVQGLGHVGFSLAAQLYAKGAKLYVADLDPAKVQAASRDFGAIPITPQSAHQAAVDIFAPCAMGGVLNASSIAQIEAPIVAGSANNQLETPQDGQVLLARGILYAPDYVINAGGVVALYHEGRGLTADALRTDIAKIGTTLGEIFTRAAQQGQAPSDMADKLAKERLSAARAAKKAA